MSTFNNANFTNPNQPRGDVSPSTPIDPFSIIDAKAVVTLAPDLLRAYVMITPPQNGGSPLTVEALKKELEWAGIKCGINVHALEKVIAFPRYNKNEVVAEALLPIKGDDARFEYKFPPTTHKAPKILPDGSVDYKNLGLLQNVRKDDVLCIRIPATEGIPGVNVKGESIPCLPGKDKKMPVGKNTLVSPDGNHILAAMDGQVDLVNNRIQIMNIVEISGDVDYSVGNIDFVGNVIVHGYVRQGFEVKAEGNVIIDGCVEGGSVIAGGNVFIHQGINAMRTGRVDCGGDLRCKYIQNGIVTVDTNLETEMILSSIVKCGGTAKIFGGNSAIIASRVMARHSIDCVDVGAPSAAMPSVLEVGSDPHIMERNTNIPKEQDEIRKKLVDAEKIIRLFQELEKRGRLDEDKTKKLAELLELQKSQQQKLTSLFMEKVEIDQRMVSAGYGNINIRGTAYAKTSIIIGTEKKFLQTNYSYTMFTRSADGIVTSSAHS